MKSIVRSKNPIPGGRREKALSWISGHHSCVLDVGCGPSEGESVYCAKSDCVIAIDVNLTFLTENTSLIGTHLLAGDALALPVKSEAVNVVVATEVLEHVLDDQRFVSEVSRILKPGGQFIVTVPNDGPFGFLDPNHFLPARAVLRIVGKKKQPIHRHYSLNEIVGIVGEDFHVEEVSRTGCYVTGVCVLLVQASKLLGLDWLQRLFNAVGSHDYRLEFGAGAYNLALNLRKKP